MTQSVPSASVAADQEVIEIIGAREHNLKDVNLTIPRNKLIVITGVSGSGKSSLAFDTIYAEGQRRYLESFSAYVRNFIGTLERPDVDKINGLSPVISIEQKTITRNPRSTVGTVTEIYDFFRLLFARAGEAYSYHTGKKMQQQTEAQIIDTLCKRYKGKKNTLLASVVKARKGHYRELFVQLRKQGYTKVRVDGKIVDLEPKMQLDRFKIHDIELVIDRIVPNPTDKTRITQSVNLALKIGNGVMAVLDEKEEIRYFSKHLMDTETGLSYDDPAPNLFSFNSPYGSCPVCNGIGTIEEITQESIIPSSFKSIKSGAILPIGEYKNIWIFNKIENILKKHKATLSTPVKEIPPDVLRMILYGNSDNPSEKTEAFEGVIAFLQKQLREGTESTRKWVRSFATMRLCPECQGVRLKKESLYFKIAEKNIAELADMDIATLSAWCENIEERMTEKQRLIAREALKEIRKRIKFLLDVGLDYLQMNRAMASLSGGETQRIRLATQIGTQLVGVLYILDEPSIGLHARDNQKLIQALKDLRDLGNTVIVVEHDKEIMLEADYIIDIGPGAGVHGGHVIAQGNLTDFLRSQSATADYLSSRRSTPVPATRRQNAEQYLALYGATGHNLKGATFKVPLSAFTCVTGVSGSGKSTLIHDTLFPILNRYFLKTLSMPSLPYKRIEGMEYLDKVIEIDQTPIGRTPRSNPATYTGVFSDIRELFAQMPEAKIRNYKVGRFSFNVKGGRCETCQGGGVRLIEMDFLPDVYVPCETCKGKRYNRETLDVRFKGKSISDVLEMTVEEAVIFFENQPKIQHKMKTLESIGLGYITLGQHATTLSGGEAQRLKLATELARRDTGKTLYILDEPTTGLHFQDIQHLLEALQKLIDRKNTVIVIEHNMDVIKAADYIIDLGPEGGQKGGEIVASGSPEEVIRNTKSITGRYLQKELASVLV